MDNIRKKASTAYKSNFDKTLTHQFGNYTKLLNEERKSPKEQIQFKNSMNRILAAEMINYRLMSAGHFLRPTQSVRVESLHK